MRKFFIILFISFSLFSSCKYALNEAFYRAHDVSERASEVYELSSPVQSDSDFYGKTFSVVFFSDIHFGKAGSKRYEENFLTWLTSFVETNEVPAFCVCLGDIADHGLEEEFIEYNSFAKRVNELLGGNDNDVKVLNVLGNHDLYNSGWLKYKENIYPHSAFYYFTTKSFSFYVIDSASGSMGLRQLSIFKEAVEQDEKLKIVCGHIPVYGDPLLNFDYFSMQNSYETDRLLSMFAENNVKYVIEGHIHSYYRKNFGNFIEYIVPGITSSNEWSVLYFDDSTGCVKKEELYLDGILQ